MPALTCNSVDLKIISFFIAYIQFIGTAVLAVFTTFSIIALAHAINSEFYEYIDDFVITLLVFSCVLLGFQLLDLAFVVGLLYGLHSKTPSFLRAYYIYTAFYLLMFVADFIGTAVIIGSVALVTIGTRVVPIVIEICFLLLIRSRFYQMENGTRRTGAVHYAC